MRSTFKTLFYINRQKTKADGKTTILCRITHRRKEYRHYHRRGMQILRVEQQERTDNRQENQSKNRRVQRTCRKDLSGDIDKGRSGKRGTAQEPFAGDSHHADNTSCHEQGRTAIRQRVRGEVKDGGNLSEPVLL